MGLRDAERALLASPAQRLLAIVDDGAVFGVELQALGFVFGRERQKARLLGGRSLQPQLEAGELLPILVVGRQVLLACPSELLFVGARETALFGGRGGELDLQPGDAIAGLAFSDQERQLVLFGPSLELGGLLPVFRLSLLAIRDLRLEGRGQTLPFGLILLDLRGKLLAFRERLFELLARLCLSVFERGGLLPVLCLPLLAIRDLRLEGRGQTLPFGLILLDLRGKLPAFRERLFELLARLCLSVFERGGLLPVLRLPLLAIRDLRLEGRGQTLPFGLILLDLRGKLLAFRERLFELLARLCLSVFERGGLLPVLCLPLLAIRDLRLEGGGQTLPLGLILLDLRGKLLAFRERLFELLARLCLSVFERGGLLPVLASLCWRSAICASRAAVRRCRSA